MSDTNNPLLDAALRYAARGWYVFPLLAGLKVPLGGSEGWKDGTTDEARIRGWWAENPRYNVGIATGPSGLMVIDVDPEGDWDALAAQHPELPGAYADAPVVNTPRGGFHVYLSGAGRTTASKISPHIDTRSTGGYVVAPPSRVTDGKANGDYGWEADSELCDPQPAPAALLERLKVTERHAPNLPASDIAWDDPATINRATSWLTTIVEQGQVAVEGCGGDQQTYETACKLLEMGIKPATALHLLLEHWNPHCSPPWDADDLRTKIENAWRYGEETKGGKAERPLAEEHAHLLNTASSAEAADPILRRINIMSVTEMQRTMKPPEWLIHRFLPKVGTGIIHAPKQSLKTFIALDIAMSLATGHGPNWWKGDDKAPQDVLFLAGEGPHAFATERVPAWLAARMKPGINADRLFVNGYVPPFDSPHLWRAMFNQMQERKIAPRLLVIDTLSRGLVGMDENSSRDAGLVTAKMENFSYEHGCFVLMIHHSGKDADKGARGSSAWGSNADVEIRVERPVKRELGVNIHADKVKDGDEDICIRFEGAPYGNSVAFTREWDYVPAKHESVTHSTEEWLQPQALAKALQGSPMSTDHLARSLSSEFMVDEKTVRRGLMKAKAGRYRPWVPEGDIWRVPGDFTAKPIEETEF